MDRGRKFPPRRSSVKTHQGTQERSGGGHVDRPSNRVGASRDGNARARGDPSSSLMESTGKKSLTGEFGWRPYRKPTQVGEASSLR